MTDLEPVATCDDVYNDPMGGITAHCILDPPRRHHGHTITHLGPHWGPIDGTDTMIEWPR